MRGRPELSTFANESEDVVKLRERWSKKRLQAIYNGCIRTFVVIGTHTIIVCPESACAGVYSVRSGTLVAEVAVVGMK
jgi:hypothetical protein